MSWGISMSYDIYTRWCGMNDIIENWDNVNYDIFCLPLISL